MITIITFAVVTLLLLVFLVYYSELHTVLKLITLPFAILLCGLVTNHYYENLGKPLEQPIPAEITYIHHEVANKYVFVWVKTKGRGHRLHKVPYDRELVKALEEAKKKKRSTKGDVEVKKEGKAEGNGSELPTYKVKVKRPRSGEGETK